MRTDDRALVEGTFGFRTPNVITTPGYAKEQRVCFIGGIGIIKSYQFDKTWSYVVEMPLSSALIIGRVGSEKAILLDEADIQAY